MAAMPLVPRFAIRGAAAAFLLGALAGLVIGLLAYPPTVWFAVVEAGIPAAILGAVGGALTGAIDGAIRRANDR